MTMLDLCCGLGGASRAMHESTLPLRPFPVDLLWASPPCAQFTLWRLPWIQAVRLRREPDLSIVLAVRAVVEEWKPRYWVIENVWASRQWLTPILGPVRAMVDGHVLWGNLPGLVPQFKRMGTQTKETRGPTRLRHQLRAIIPYEISLALALATERRIHDNG